jgi:hypothetical protein
MDTKLGKMFLISVLFVIGILIGLESANGGLEKGTDEEMDITPSSYVTRIENGELIMVPAHGSGNEAVIKENENGKQGKKDEKESLKSEVNSPDEQRSVQVNKVQEKQELLMNREGFLDRLGYNMGNAISSWTRTALEKAIGAFVD